MNSSFKTLLLITAGLLAFQACTQNAKTLKTAADLADAIRKNNTVSMSAWLKSGGNPNDIIGGESPLYIATGPKGGHEMVQLLLENGADVNQGAGQYTPLMNAASWVDLQGVELLLAYKASKTLVNEEGKTAIELIGDCGNCPEQKQILALLQ